MKVSCRLKRFLYNYRFILYFDYFSFTGVDSVSVQVTSFIVRPWVYYDESAIEGYFKILYHKSFIYVPSLL